LINSEQMAQVIINTALDAFVQTDEACVILDWSPNAQALTAGPVRRRLAGRLTILSSRNRNTLRTASG
jgi:hypothetical protein